MRRPVASFYAAALAACCAARRMARSLQCRRLGLRAGIQCHQVYLNRSCSASRAHRHCFSLLSHRCSPHRRRKALARPWSEALDRGEGAHRAVAMEVGVEVAKEGAAVVVPRARRRHPPVDAEDIVDGTARAAMLAARVIGSRSHHRHLLRLLPLPPRRRSLSMLTGSSSASPSTMTATRTPLGYPASSATSSTSGRTRSC
jgi:hypothetical protein